MAFKKLRDVFKGSSSGEDYLEIDIGQPKKDSKVVVRLFIMKDYEDTNFILNSLREGYTIAIIDIKTLKKKDPVELRRAITKVKKTVDAMDGSIAGFGDVIVATPAFATIPKEVIKKKEERKDELDEY